MSALATAAHLRLTEFFIAENPISVALKRSVVTPTGTGGTHRAPPSIVGEVRGRLVASSRVGQGVAQMTADGALVTATHTFVMLPDTDVQLHDKWDGADGNVYEVIGLSTSPPWRLTAEVYRHVH